MFCQSEQGADDGRSFGSLQQGLVYMSSAAAEPGKLQTRLGLAFSDGFLMETQPPPYSGSGEAQGPGSCMQGFVLKPDALHACKEWC